MSNTIDPEVLDRLLEILDKPYKCAKLGILDLESKFLQLNGSFLYWKS